MRLLDVVPHVRIVHEVLLAVVALEVAFPRVHYIVGLQLIHEGELQIALIAADLLEVQPHVADDGVDVSGGSLSAQIARVHLAPVGGPRYGVVACPVLFRLVVGILLVDALVRSEVCGSVEFQRAQVAAVVLVFVVQLQVGIVAGQRVENFVADVALMSFGLWAMEPLHVFLQFMLLVEYLAALVTPGDK